MRELDYSRESHLLLLDLINLANRDIDPNWVDLTLQQISLHGPRQIVDSPDWRDTEITILPVEGGGWENSKVVRYRRINATKAFAGRDIYIKPEAQTRASDLLTTINERYGLGLIAADIIDEPIDVHLTPYPYTIKIKSNNVSWIGEIKVIIEDKDTSLGWLITDPDMDEFYYPNKKGGIKQAYAHAYLMDFTVIQPWLSEYQVDQEADSMLMAFIKQVDTETEWIYQNGSVPLPYNIYGSIIEYNGPAIPEYTSRLEFEHIMVVRLNDLKCKGISGGLILHYNTADVQLGDE